MKTKEQEWEECFWRGLTMQKGADVLAGGGDVIDGMWAGPRDGTSAKTRTVSNTDAGVGYVNHYANNA